jgi:hypothetical protein
MAKATRATFEAALDRLVDITEEHLDTLSPEERKARLKDFHATASRILGRHATQLCNITVGTRGFAWWLA